MIDPAIKKLIRLEKIISQLATMLIVTLLLLIFACLKLERSATEDVHHDQR